MRASRTICWLSAAAFTVLTVGATIGLAGERLQARSDTEEVAVDERGSVKAKCSRGTQAVSGGFESEFTEPPLNFPFLRMDGSRRTTSRSWVSSGFSDGDVPGDLTSFAYCRDQELTTTEDTVTAPVGQFVTARARCPKGTKVISGGFEGSPIDTVGTTPVLYVSESRRAGRRTWEASAHSNGNEPGELTATANCGRGPKPKANSNSITLSDTPPGNPFDKVVARCKRGQRVVSGGFGSPDESGEATPAFLTSKKKGTRRWKVAAFYGSIGAPIEITAYAYCEPK